MEASNGCQSRFTSLVVDGNQVLSLCGPHFKTLSETSCFFKDHLKSSTYKCGLYLKTPPESSLILLTPVKSSIYEFGPHFNTLSESRSLLMDPLKSSTYKSGLYLKTPPKSSPKTTPTLYHIICHYTVHTLDSLDIERLLNQLFYTIKNKSLAFI
ncbi:unnamed protein product [Absidia cylindrospora]